MTTLNTEVTEELNNKSITIKITQDPITQDPITQDPITQDPIAQDQTTNPITQCPITQDPINTKIKSMIQVYKEIRDQIELLITNIRRKLIDRNEIKRRMNLLKKSKRELKL